MEDYTKQEREFAAQIIIDFLEASDGTSSDIAVLEAVRKVRAETAMIERERCAKIAEHLNGWGSPPAPELAAHIAKIIRE